MQVDASKVSAAAPDAASLAAGRKLSGPAKWSGLGSDGPLVWGDCQGSGSNPYRVVADLSDFGSKCSCPSRKFPCKHGLGIMLGVAAGTLKPAPAERPQWIVEWMGRRRGVATPLGRADGTSAPAVAAAADPKAEERARAQRERNRERREASVLEGVDTLERWLLDWCAKGLSGLASSGTSEADGVARRLVDAKAPGLANRLQLAFADMAGLPDPARPPHLLRELGVIATLCAAYRNQAALSDAVRADVREEAGWSVRREDLLADGGPAPVSGRWTVVSARVAVQSDGMQRSETWLVGTSGDAAGRQALLLDFMPSSAGKIGNPRVPGEGVEATLAFHPAGVPLRAAAFDMAVLAEAELPPEVPLPDFLARRAAELAAAPWRREVPFALRNALVSFGTGGFVLSSGGMTLPMDLDGTDEDALVLSGQPLACCGGTFADGRARVSWCRTADGDWRAAR